MAERLKLPRDLDLNVPQDRDLLRVAARGLPEIAQLLEDHLHAYLAWFSAPEWRQLTTLGVASPATAGGKHRRGYALKAMLSLTRDLKELQSYEGFADLIANLANPSQVEATIFEIKAATWCAGRAVHESLRFGPPVIKGQTTKKPDFLWRTSLGDLICECKEAQQYERDETLRLHTLNDVVYDALGGVPDWPDDLRLDIVIDGSLGTNPDERLRQLVRDVAAAVRRGNDRPTRSIRAFEATVRPRAEEPPDIPDSQLVGKVIVGTSGKPVQVTPRNSALTLTRSLASTRAKLVTDLLKRAKKQLPDNGPAGVFIQMGGAGRAAQRLEETLAHPAHRAVVWACVCSDGQPQFAVWQADQPFDGRLLSGSGFGDDAG